MKILTVLGARPQFIKAATVSRAIAKYRASVDKEIEEIIVHTGQHYDANMSDIFFEEMDIPKPKHKLGFGNLKHGAMTGGMLEKCEELIVKEKPFLVLVYGDTNSTLAGALAASKMHVPVAHVEAGLRSFNMAMPEEINRVLTDRIANYLFCPTENAVENLGREGFPFDTPNRQNQKIFNVGDVMYDATRYYANKADDYLSLEKWGLREREYALCTIHRPQNTDNSSCLKSIFTALQKINQDLEVVIPLHPRTRNILKQSEQSIAIGNLKIIEPLSYLEMQRLEKSARVVITDSGGMQKEAYFHGVPCLTLREETEWVETLVESANTLVGANEEKIISAFRTLSPNFIPKDIYGDGMASSKIVSELMNSFH